MLLRAIATALITLTVGGLSLPPALALDFPTAQCSLDADKSTLALIVSNSSDVAYACSATCQYKVAGERPLQTFSCSYSLGANTEEKVACDLDGKGPGHFAEVRPTRVVCQPR